MTILFVGVTLIFFFTLVFCFVENVFTKNPQYEVNYTTFPHYIRAFELLIALDTGSLALLVYQSPNLISLSGNTEILTYAIFSFISSLVLGFIFIIVFIRGIQSSTPQPPQPPQPSIFQKGDSTLKQFLIEIPLAITAIITFAMGYAYLAQMLLFPTNQPTTPYIFP